MGGVVISLGFAGSRYMLFLPHLTVILRSSLISLSLSLLFCFLHRLWFVRLWIFWIFFVFFFWSAKFVTLLLSLSWNCVDSSEKLRYFKEIWIFIFFGVNNGIGRIQRKKLHFVLFLFFGLNYVLNNADYRALDFFFGIWGQIDWWVFFVGDWI